MRRGTGATRSGGAAFIAAALCAGAVLAGCRGDRSDDPPRQFFPDLDDQMKVKPQSESEFYAEYQDEATKEWYGRSMREPVPGTVPFAQWVHARLEDGEPAAVEFEDVDFARRAYLLRDQDDVFFTGTNPDGSYAEYMPVPMSAELIALGQKNFNIFCYPCHGGTGEGNGLVGVRWATTVPSYHQPQYEHGGEKGQDGFLFHTLRNGVPNVGGKWELKMPAYGGKLDEMESWAVVAYLRVLQRSRSMPFADLPEREKAELERRRGAPPPEPAASAPARDPGEEAAS